MLNNPKIIFSDFDGTLTHKGELGPIFFKVLERVKEMDAELIVVSGRSISWGHFLLTHLPIRYCIMEGGGVILKKGPNKTITEMCLVSQGDLKELDSIERGVSKRFPESMSADSFGRKTDRAIEMKDLEDVSKIEIEKFLTDRKASFSSSNVHINFWVGDVSKYQGIEVLLKEEFPGVIMDECLFFGDAPNDSSVFQNMKHTIGVSNISRYLDRIEHHPSIILKGDENKEVRGVYNFLNSLK